MKKLFAMGAALFLFGTGVVGCSNTAQGAAEDASKDTQAVKDAAATAADKTVQGTKEAGKAIEHGAAVAGQEVEKGVVKTGEAVKDAGKAVEHGAAVAGKEVEHGVANASKAVSEATKDVMEKTLTPKVKTAILQDPSFSDIDKYKLNVDTKDNKVILRGTVATEEMKKTAVSIAEKTVKDNNYSNPVVDQLTVGKPKM